MRQLGWLCAGSEHRPPGRGRELATRTVSTAAQLSSPGLTRAAARACSHADPVTHLSPWRRRSNRLRDAVTSFVFPWRVLTKLQALSRRISKETGAAPPPPRPTPTIYRIPCRCLERPAFPFQDSEADSKGRKAINLKISQISVGRNNI